MLFMLKTKLPSDGPPAATGKGQAWHWAVLLRLFLPGAWGNLCQIPDPGPGRAGGLGERVARTLLLLVVGSAPWAQLSGPPPVAKRVGKGTRQVPRRSPALVQAVGCPRTGWGFGQVLFM